MKKLISGNVSKLIFVALLLNAFVIPTLQASEASELGEAKGRIDTAWRNFKQCITKRKCSKKQVAAMVGAAAALLLLVVGIRQRGVVVSAWKELSSAKKWREYMVTELDNSIRFIELNEQAIKGKIRSRLVKERDKSSFGTIGILPYSDEELAKKAQFTYDSELFKSKRLRTELQTGFYSDPGFYSEIRRDLHRNVAKFLGKELSTRFNEQLTRE